MRKSMFSVRSLGAVAAAGILLTVVATSSGAVPTDANSDLGTPSGTSLSYTAPTPLTVTISSSGGFAPDFASGAQSMNSTGWWGGATSGSISNMTTAYTPTSVKDATGLTVGWWSDELPGAAAAWPSVGTPIYRENALSEITFTFSRPVTNAVMHLHNLGGNKTQTGHDYTMFSDWKITSGQTLEMLSGSATTNITSVTNNHAR